MPKRKVNVEKQKKANRMFSWIKLHKVDVLIVSALLAITGFVSAVNMTGYPQRFEDEGTYISQAWAIQEKGVLTHYTYWYDHPPAGWIQMAAHLVLTNATGRYTSSITAGREFMLFMHLATIVLMYALARRLGIGKTASVIGVLAYGLSPLVVEFSRYVLLDNVALPWALGAFLLALSSRRNITTAVGSAVCMAIAILSKETFLALLPVLLYALWETGDKRNRRYTLAVFISVLVMVSGLYILYAALKNELFPGDGHVSMLGTLVWQIFGREGSGSILSSGSSSRGLFEYWMNIDRWLLIAGVVALPFAFFYRRLRVVAFALLISLAMLLRTGYLPYPYIIALLPFAALVFAGVLHYAIIIPLQERGNIKYRLPAGVIGVALVAASLIFVAPGWQSKLNAISSTDQDASSRQTVDWIESNISVDKRMVVESPIWSDLQNKGFSQPEPVWLYKTETDPAVTKVIGGWEGIDYVILNGPTIGASNFESEFPTVSEAIKNSRLVKEFGKDNQKILIYEIQHKK